MNNPDDISMKTGYYPGNVYIYDKDKDKDNQPFDSPERYDDPLLYDPDTKNFHIVPNKTVCNNTDFIDLVRGARQTIINELKNCGDVTKDKDDNTKPWLNPNIGRNAPNKYRNIEKAIQIEWNKNKYLLCFERLYTHKNKVHCMFGLFQFYKYPAEDKYINIIDNTFSMCYPSSFRNNTKNINGSHIVFNPDLPSVFELKESIAKNICDAFIAFVKEN